MNKKKEWIKMIPDISSTSGLHVCCAYATHACLTHKHIFFFSNFFLFFSFLFDLGDKISLHGPSHLGTLCMEQASCKFAVVLVSWPPKLELQVCGTAPHSSISFKACSDTFYWLIDSVLLYSSGRPGTLYGASANSELWTILLPQPLKYLD